MPPFAAAFFYLRFFDDWAEPLFSAVPPET